MPPTSQIVKNIVTQYARRWVKYVVLDKSSQSKSWEREYLIYEERCSDAQMRTCLITCSACSTTNIVEEIIRRKVYKN
jgi:hypothetical protein